MMTETARIPQTFEGWGVTAQALNTLIDERETCLWVVSPSIQKTDVFKALPSEIMHHCITISGEPNPDDVDQIAETYRKESIDCIIALGGGSVMDFSKALAGILNSDTASVMDYLEGVGRDIPYELIPVRWIAIPTTPGTGAEVTKNAVLSKPGLFKKSFRDDRLIADAVVLDAQWLSFLPKSALAATVMDGLTQLIEAYTSTQNNSTVDALIASVTPGLFDVIERLIDDSLTHDDYHHLARAGMISGIALANCGLGMVHSYASAVGAYTHAPHGVVCARLLPKVTEYNLERMETDSDGYQRYVNWTYWLNPLMRVEELSQTFAGWVRALNISPLGDYGLKRDNCVKIIQETLQKTNPVDYDIDSKLQLLESELY